MKGAGENGELDLIVVDKIIRRDGEFWLKFLRFSRFSKRYWGLMNPRDSTCLWLKTDGNILVNNNVINKSLNIMFPRRILIA